MTQTPKNLFDSKRLIAETPTKRPVFELSRLKEFVEDEADIFDLLSHRAPEQEDAAL